MSEAKGCSVVAVVLVAALMLVVGFAVGGAVVWFLYVQDAPPPEAPSEPPQVVTPTKQPSQPTQRYAALLPLEETLRIEGPMPPMAVRDILLGGKRFKLRECYQAGVERNPELRGEMSLQFTVAGSNGVVTAAIERHTDFSDKGVRDCILKEVKSWEFPPQKSQSVVRFDLLMMSMSGNETP